MKKFIEPLVELIIMTPDEIIMTSAFGDDNFASDDLFWGEE